METETERVASWRVRRCHLRRRLTDCPSRCPASSSASSGLSKPSNPNPNPNAYAFHFHSLRRRHRRRRSCLCSRSYTSHVCVYAYAYASSLVCVGMHLQVGWMDEQRHSGRRRGTCEVLADWQLDDRVQRLLRLHCTGTYRHRSLDFAQNL